jgi:hypothetical protein
MVEQGWHMVWLDWKTFFGMVIDEGHPGRHTVTTADVIICGIDFSTGNL